MSVKIFLQFFYIHIQLVQVDVSENRRQYATLGRSAVCIVVCPFFNISSFEELPYKLDKSGILYFLGQQRNQHFMVDIIEASFYVAFYEPSYSTESVFYFPKSRVAAAVRTKTMR